MKQIELITTTKFHKTIFSHCLAKTTSLKQAEEKYELFLVKLMRSLSRKEADWKKTFEIIKKIYKVQQPLTTRTSQSVKLNAYSTPIPLAYLISYYCSVTAGTDNFVLDPTAGNGALLMTAHKAIANEIDPIRYQNLCKQQKHIQIVTNEDVHGLIIPREAKYRIKAIACNPPFGKTPGSDTKFFPGLVLSNNGVNIPNIQKYKTNNQGWAIAIQSICKLNTGGNGVLILPSYINDKKSKWGKDKQKIINIICGFFQEITIIRMDGSMYSKQGASYPIEVFILSGKQNWQKPQYSLSNPSYDCSTWEEVLNVFAEPISKNIVNCFSSD